MDKSITARLLADPMPACTVGGGVLDFALWWISRQILMLVLLAYCNPAHY